MSRGGRGSFVRLAVVGIVRMFCGMPTSDLLYQPSGVVLLDVFGEMLPSDRAPVEVCFTSPASCRVAGLAPLSRSWMRFYVFIGYGGMPAFEELATKTEIVQRVARHVARSAASLGPLNRHYWRNQWAVAAGLAWGRGRFAEALRCVERVPEARHMFMGAGGMFLGAFSEAAIVEFW